MKATVKWLDHMSFVGEAGSGHSVVMDGPPDDGGRNMGVRPMEMVLLGMGGCTAFDVVHILKRARPLSCHLQVGPLGRGGSPYCHPLGPLRQRRPWNP